MLASEGIKRRKRLSGFRPWLFFLSLVILSAPLGAAELEPAFRLPAGGRPLVPPLLDSRLSPAAVWFLSEDHFLYLLSETGKLLAKRPLPGGAFPFLALDPYGRALLLIEGGQGKPSSLAVFTRRGGKAFQVGLGNFLAPEKGLLAPAFGADGRLFLGSEDRLLCLSQSGTRLWSRRLPDRLALPPAVDGAGRPLLALADGSILLLSPYGGELGRIRAAAPVHSLGAFAAGSAAELAAGRGIARPYGVAGLENGDLVLIDGDGDAFMSLGPGGGAVRSFVSDGIFLYGLTERGRVLCLDVSGSLLWSVETGVEGGDLALFAERLVATGRGKAVSLSRKGAIYREATIRNAAAPALLAPSGLLFSAGEDWILAAYRFERPLGQALKVAPLPYGRDEGAVGDALLFDPELQETERQLALLGDIEKSLKSDMIGEEERRDAALLEAVALGSFLGDYPDGERRFRANPLPRARACALLGALGSPDYREPLVRVLRNDEDPAVQAAAIRALGAIAVDPDGEAGAAMLAAASPSRLDASVASALVEAIEATALRSGSPPSVEAVRALLKLVSGQQAGPLRERALRALGVIAEGL